VSRGSKLYGKKCGDQDRISLQLAGKELAIVADQFSYVHTKATELLASRMRDFERLSAVLLDIDDFHSKLPGDRDATDKTGLLDRLLEELRVSLQAQPQDTCRHGRDSLLLVFPQKSVAEICQRTYEALINFRSQWVELQGRDPVRLSFTAAAGEAPEHGETATLLLRVLENTLFQAKSEGKNRVALPQSRKMTLKSSYFPDAQLQRLANLASRMGLPEAELLRLALDEFLRKYEE
jgi:GGDEF domain-containing protein